MERKNARILRLLSFVALTLHIPLAALYFFGDFGKGFVSLWSVVVLPLAMLHLLLACTGTWKVTAVLSFMFAILQIPPIWGWSLVGLGFVPAAPNILSDFSGVAALIIHGALIIWALFSAKKSYDLERGATANDVP